MITKQTNQMVKLELSGNTEKDCLLDESSLGFPLKDKLREISKSCRKLLEKSTLARSD